MEFCCCVHRMDVCVIVFSLFFLYWCCLRRVGLCFFIFSVHICAITHCLDGVPVKQQQQQHNSVTRRFRCMCSATARFGIFNWTTLIDFHLTGRFSSAGRWSNAILDLSGHGHKRLLNIGSIFGRCLEEWNAQLVCVFLK